MGILTIVLQCVCISICVCKQVMFIRELDKADNMFLPFGGVSIEHGTPCVAKL